MRCGLCYHFHLSPKHTKDDKGMKTRICALSFDEVYPDKESCTSFRLYHLIYCPFEGKMLQRSVEACVYRQKIKRCKCKLGVDIKKILRKKPVTLKRRNNHA